MRLLDHLPEPPLYHIEVDGDRLEPGPGFLRYVSRRVHTVDGEGNCSQSFVYDEVDRRCLDAVVVVPYFFSTTPPGSFEAEPADSLGDAYVVLRSAVRPPVALRSQDRSPVSEPENRGLWEFPAGLIEPEEQSGDGVVRAACRELLEETGFSVAPSMMKSLGPSMFPAPGMIAERQFYFFCEVDPHQRVEPRLDGSALEEAGEVVAVPLWVAQNAAKLGRLGDLKTELCLFRLREQLRKEESQ